MVQISLIQQVNEERSYTEDCFLYILRVSDNVVKRIYFVIIGKIYIQASCTHTSDIFIIMLKIGISQKQC